MVHITICNPYVVCFVVLIFNPVVRVVNSNKVSINSMGKWVSFEEPEPVNSGTLSPLSRSWAEPTAEIFVGMIHYRDRRCSLTVENLLTKAKYPERIHIGTLIESMCSTLRSKRINNSNRIRIAAAALLSSATWIRVRVRDHSRFTRCNPSHVRQLYKSLNIYFCRVV